MHEAIRFLRQLQTSLLANNMLNTYVFKSWCHFIQMVSIATNIILEKKILASNLHQRSGSRENIFYHFHSHKF